MEGQLGIINNCISQAVQHKRMDDDDDLFADNKVDFGDIQFDNDNVVDDDDEDDENVVSLEKIKKQVMGDDEESELNFDASGSIIKIINRLF